MTSIDLGKDPQFAFIGSGAFSDTIVEECSCGGDACPVEVEALLAASHWRALEICFTCAIGEKYSSEATACMECPLELACPDGKKCADGYEGVGCSTCSPEYFLLNEECTECPGTNIVVLLTLGVVFTAVFGVAVYYLSGQLIHLAGVSTISIGHFQTISVFMNISLPIPKLFYSIANKIQALFAFMYIDLFFSPECAVNNVHFYTKWFMLTIIPIVLLVVLYAWEGCRCLNDKVVRVEPSLELQDVMPDEGKNSIALVDSKNVVTHDTVVKDEIREQEDTEHGTWRDSSHDALEQDDDPDDTKMPLTEQTNMQDVNETGSFDNAAIGEQSKDGTTRNVQSDNSSLLSRCTSKIPTPIFGRMVNLGIVIFYVFILGQCWKIWDCKKLENGSYVLQSKPSILCFTRIVRFDMSRYGDGGYETYYWYFVASIAMVLALLTTYMPYKLYKNLRYELEEANQDESECIKSMQFLCTKYKPEYWYWEPVVEMPRKWFVVFFATFMPTGQSQAAMDIVVTLGFWYLHYKHEPYRTDWKDAHGNPADPDLENNLQHYMYAIQIFIVVAMMSYESYEENPDVGGAVLLFFYFTGIILLAHAIFKLMMRQHNRNNVSVSSDDLESEGSNGKQEMSGSCDIVHQVLDGMGGA